MTDPVAPDPEAGPTACETCSACALPDRRIGVLLVHGMGEQNPGDHAEKVVRSLIASWAGDYEVRQVWQRARTCPGCGRCLDTAEQSGDGVGAKPSASREGPQIIARVQVGGGRNETVDLHLHEVWWADLGQRTGLRNWGRFTWWVVRAPFLVFRAGTGRFDEKRWMKRGEAAGLVRVASLRSGLGRLPQFLVLFCFSILALITGLTWGLLRRLLHGFAPSPVVLLQSFGDVQIYTEGARTDTGSGTDMGLPPRVPIRRRMVQEMVAMAERDYNRWYVMAHSLGSVVAFNGLMEPDYLLPNYLEEEHWDRLDERFKTEREDDDTEKMRPRRSAWLGSKDALSRKELFRGLGGLVTYGSPLHLFVDLWPHIVMLNKNDVFVEGFRWINVCSPFDPISGALRAFCRSEDAAKARLQPQSFRFSGNRWAFIAHGAYLKTRRARRDVAHYLGKWWLRQEDFATPAGGQWGSWFVAFSQILLASALLLVACSVEGVAAGGLARRLWDALLVGWAEMCCLATLAVS